jgi:asparagine synthase (glutamine-hydrolysing)
MCGIAGFVDTDGMDRASGEALARAMATPLTPRGPDDSGAWSNGTVGLGFRRLAIVDLSPAGHQPMTSASGHLTITFNGEIYNHGELRAELAGRGARFRGRSDTEVLLAAIETWGVAATLPRLRGMFAFAVWDARDRSLTLARDRFGEKPLYLGWARDRRLFVFGSQLAALRAHPDVELTIDRAALLGFVRYSYVPHPRSIYEGLGKLPPGTWQRVWADGRATAPTSYYSLAAVAEANLAARTKVDLGDAAAQVEAALTRAVREQMVADVPLGAFLSGGIDSSLIVMLMQRHAQTPVRTFSIGFDQAAYDESAYARDVASRLGTEHTEFHVTGADALAIVPDLPDIYDEPFADSSQLPTTLVARLARRHVTVVLAGDGGDELFAGYPRFADLRRVDAAYGVPGRRAVATLADRLVARLQDGSSAPGPWQRRLDWLRRRTDLASQPDLDGFYQRVMSLWFCAEDAVPGAVADRGVLPLAPEVLAAGNPTERAMVADLLSHFTDQLLVKVDRAAMSTSLETRLPFLDHELYELSWRLPFATKVVGDRAKVVLRHVLDKQLPAALFDRPKMGFMIPLAAWLRGPLRDWAEALLEPRALAADGLLAPAIIRRRWSAFLAGDDAWRTALWPILMWQAWRARYR